MAISNELRMLVDPNNKCCCEDCLSNKCKEWASNQYMNITSTTVRNWKTTGEFVKGKSKTKLTHWYAEAFINLELYLDEYGNPYQKAMFAHKRFKAKTEPQAIFKACKWILDNKESK